MKKYLLLLIPSVFIISCSSFSLQEKSKIDRNGIRKTFSSNYQPIKKCYEDIPAQKRMDGKIVFDFDIDDQGKVVRSEVHDEKTTLKSKELGDCIIGQMKTWTFPPSPATTTTQILYPLVFKRDSKGTTSSGEDWF